MRGRYWTTKEISRLRQLAGTLPRPEIAAALGRPENSVKRKAYELGIRELSSRPGWAVAFAKPPRENWRLWSPSEVARLKELAGTMSTPEIAAALDRPVHSVKGKARGLGLKLRTYGESCSWSKYSDALCEQARQLHRSKVPLPEISRRLGIPYHSLHSIVYFKRGRGALVELARVTPRYEGLLGQRVISLETPTGDGLRLEGVIRNDESPDPLGDLLEGESIESIVHRLIAERGLDLTAAHRLVAAHL